MLKSVSSCLPPYRLLLLAVALPCAAHAFTFAALEPAGSVASAEPAFLPAEQAFRLQRMDWGSELHLHFDIAPGYYLYHERMQLSTSDGRVLTPRFSAPGHIKQDRNFGAVRVHDGALDLRLSRPATATSLTLRYQGCASAGLCYPPQSRSWSLEANKEAIPARQQPAASPATAAAAEDSIARLLAGASRPLVLLGFLVLGLGLALTPCVFPMIPIVAAIIAGAGPGLSLRRGFMLALSYVLGMAVAYAIAGAAMGYFGAEANVAAVLQQPWALTLFAGVFVVLALSMLGAFELRLPSALLGRLDAAGGRLHGGQHVSVFLMGALSVLVMSPCVSAPLAGVLVYISGTGDALFGAAALFFLGLGMGAPLLLIGAGGGSLLPRAGAWMVAVRRLFGIGLLGLAIGLLGRVLPAAATLLLWGLLLLGTAQGVGMASSMAPWRRMLSWPLAVWGILALVGSALGNGNVLAPLAGLPRATAPQQVEASTAWETLTDPAELGRRVAGAGRPVLLEVYADWCTACKDMERTLFTRDDVKALFQPYRRLRLDISAGTPAQQVWLQQHQLFGPPALLVLDGRSGQERLRLVGEVPLALVCARLAPAPGSNPCRL